eukprot:CAMPEP_0201896754 /NCGR_PEP_ID=MMETSP0902-20130614/45273_1 /ASSEMBLY_ACC=CAM_ASM_000551 /TAXON_ID=420261 /ORGANISM="Thalassiosira antarctica, Strain CCMP982" /LENGTH=115 /DNA_ID=CAMNT_0048429423 /DNA_START=917 /DNA_END=1264 /DNA_ORIENTATION=-
MGGRTILVVIGIPNNNRCTTLDVSHIKLMVQERVCCAHIKPSLSRADNAAFHVVLQALHDILVFFIKLGYGDERFWLKAIEKGLLNAARFIKERSGVSTGCHEGPPRNMPEHSRV